MSVSVSGVISAVLHDVVYDTARQLENTLSQIIALSKYKLQEKSAVYPEFIKVYH